MDATPDRKLCPSCGKVKPLGAYYACRMAPHEPAWSCKVCSRLQSSQYRETPQRREWEAAYLAREDVQAARRASNQKRYPTRKKQQDAWRATPHGKIIHARCSAKSRLRKADTPEKRARLEALIVAYDRELARIEASMDCDG